MKGDDTPDNIALLLAYVACVLLGGFTNHTPRTSQDTSVVVVKTQFEMELFTKDIHI